MSKVKRKIYKITLWIYSDDAKIDIDEFHIKRKGVESIQTEEGETLYCYMLDKPISGLILGENYIDVSMLTEDFTKIDEAIKVMINEGRNRINLQIKEFIDMHSELNRLEDYEREIYLNSNDIGFCSIKKEVDDIYIKPVRKDVKPICVKNYN